jgi:hypothetical protein
MSAGRHLAPEAPRSPRGRRAPAEWTTANTEISTWFERDRASVVLNTLDGTSIIEWWDDDVHGAVEDGFLDPRDWHGSAVNYANYVGAQPPAGVSEARRTQSVGRIEDDTPILPYVVADSVIGEVENYTDTEIPDKRELADRLSDRADKVYQSDERFRRQIRAKGNRGRDQLYVFMRHWLSAELKRIHPGIFHKLPQSFWNGEPLHGHARVDEVGVQPQAVRDPGCPSGSQAYMVGYIHKVSPSPQDVWGPVCLNDNAFSDSKTLGAALRKAHVLIPGGQVRQFRVEGDKVVVFPSAPGMTTYWHSIILTAGVQGGGHSVRDYLAIDSRDRPIAGPFKSYSDARQAAGTGGAVQFVPTGRSAPPRASEAGRGVRRPPRRRR